MANEVEAALLVEFAGEIDVLREKFPSIARELDKCLFDVIETCVPKCGYGICSCQTATFAHFHAERNLKFARAAAQRRKAINLGDQKR